MANVTLTRFMMARSLDYLLHRGQGQTNRIRESPTLSHKIQNGVPYTVHALSSLGTNRSYPNTRFNDLCFKNYMHNQYLIIT